MLFDMLESSLEGYSLESMTMGGAATPDALVSRSKDAFPTAMLFVVPSLCLCTSGLSGLL
jgi:hypothetical protein